jgi:hypothetical protein
MNATNIRLIYSFRKLEKSQKYIQIKKTGCDGTTMTKSCYLSIPLIGEHIGLFSVTRRHCVTGRKPDIINSGH